jgi:uncharacterized damage-inducible protein DinB
MDPMVHVAFGDAHNELASTRRMIAALPEAQFEFRPKPASMMLGQLAKHIVDLVGWGSMIMDTTEFDVMSRPKDVMPTTTAELLGILDANIASFEAKLPQIKPADLTVPWTLRAGERVVFTIPRGAAVRSFCISHVVHHRAQLSVYLRLLDVNVPGMYGPSADER